MRIGKMPFAIPHCPISFGKRVHHHGRSFRTHGGTASVVQQAPAR
jgi:hypothetical protein